jgi:hypothetical protein
MEVAENATWGLLINVAEPEPRSRNKLPPGDGAEIANWDRLEEI